MKFFRKTDIAVVGAFLGVCALALAVFLLAPQKQGVCAEVYVGKDLVLTVDLEEAGDYDLPIPSRPNVVLHVYPDGGVAFVRSDCPDKVCIHAGRLHFARQSAACLPNGVIVKIVASDGVDMIA